MPQIGTKKELFLKAYKVNMCNISKACEAVPINRKTFYRWIENINFKEQIKEIDESLDDMAECSLYKNVKSGMQKAVEFYLTNRKKDKYSNTNKTEHTGADGEPIKVNFIIKMGDE
uniref:Putative terminase small subunit n=1 Tax=viral metagenome TaxID=1070528 RepID=A0A6M3IF29_9ZZZZ